MNKSFSMKITKRAYVLVILALLIFASSATISLVVKTFIYRGAMEDDVNSQTTSFEIVPTLKESDCTDFAEGLQNILEKYGRTYFISEKIDEILKTHIYIFVDKSLSEKYIWAIEKNANVNLLEFDFLHEVHDEKIKNIFSSILDDENYDFYYVDKSEYNTLEGYDLSHSEVSYLLGSLDFNRSEISKGAIDEVLRLDDDNDSAKIAVTVSKTTDEKTFVKRYVIPYVIMLILFIVQSFIIYYSNVYVVKEKDDYINIMSGKKLRKIFIENTLFNMLSIVLSVVIFAILNRSIIDLLSKIYLVTVSVLFILLEIVLYLNIKINNKGVKYFDQS